MKIKPLSLLGLIAPFALGLVASATMSMSAFAADTDPIRIGLIYTKQGGNAVIGLAVQQGTVLAAEQAGNKLLGRPVEFIWLDEPSPQGSAQNMQKLIDENKVVAVMGSSLSSSALAMEAVAKRRKIPLIITQAAASEITGKECNRYTFRVSPTASVHTRMLAPYMARAGKEWYSITPSYAFGQDGLASAKVEAAKAGAKIVGVDEVALDTPDYSSFVLKIRQSKAKVVYTALNGGDLSSFLKQWNELGMKGSAEVVGIAVSDSSFWEIGPEASTGVWGKPWSYADPANPADEKTFTAAFTKKYGRPPTEKAWMGWYAMRALMQAVEKNKSTDPKAIVTGLEAWRATENGMTIRFRDFDHQLVRPALALKVKPKITDKWDYFDIVERTPNNAADLEKVYGTKEEVGCHMDEL